MTDQELKKPFTLATKAGIFPVDHDNDTMHALIVDKITGMTCKAMKMHFAATSKIQDGIHRLVEDNHKRDAAGKECLRLLTSSCPSNCNVAIAFPAACQQCIHSDSPSGRFIWAHPPEELIHHLSGLARFTLEDHLDNEFFEKAHPFLPTDIRGAFHLHNT